MPRVSLPQVLWHSKDDKHSDRVYSVDIQPSVSLQNLSLHPSFSVSAKSSSFSSSPESSSSSASFSSENHSSASSSSPPECRVPPPAGSSFRPCHPSPQSAHGLDTAPARVLLTSSNGTNLMSLSSHLHLSNSHNGVAGGGGGLLSRKEARAREKKAAILASYSRLATAGADEFIHLWRFSFESGVNPLCDPGGGGSTHSGSASGSSGGGGGGLPRNFSDLQIQCVARLLGHEREVNAVRWSPDGVYLASGGSDNSAFVWELGLKPDTLPMGYESSSALDYDEWWVRVSLYRCIEAVNSLAWAPSGAQLAIGTEDGRVIVVDCHCGVLANKSARLLEGHSNMVQGVAWDPLDVFLVSQSCDQSVRLWSRRGGGGNPGGGHANALVTPVALGLNGGSSSVGGSVLAGPPLAAGGAPAPTTKGQQWKLETVVRTARDREGKEKDGGSGAGGSLPASRDEDEDDSEAAHQSSSHGAGSFFICPSPPHQSRSFSSSSSSSSPPFRESVATSASSSSLPSCCSSGSPSFPSSCSSARTSSFLPSSPPSSSLSSGGGGGSSMARQQCRSLFYPESSLRSFFRRPDWSPDGTLLVTPAGWQFTTAYHNTNSSTTESSSSATWALSSTGSCSSSSSCPDGFSSTTSSTGQSVYSACTTAPAAAPSEKAVSTTYAFHRRLLTSYGGTPFVTHRSFAGPTIAVRFNPVTFESIAWPDGRGNPEKLPEHMKITKSWLFSPSEIANVQKKRLHSYMSMRYPGYAAGGGGGTGAQDPKAVAERGVRTPAGGGGCWRRRVRRRRRGRTVFEETPRGW